jgi:enamine deaminase RidA (YjgF/YER057c/UK114 family)
MDGEKYSHRLIQRPTQNIPSEMPMRLALLVLSLLTYMASGSAIAGTRQDAKVLMPSDSASLKIWEDWGFSDAIVTSDTIYLSGVVAGVRDGETDLRLAYTRAFERISEILKNAGATWDDVVEITSFHTDLTTQMPAMIAVKKNYVKPPFPAWTAIQVSRLIPTNGVTEIKIVAKLRK